MHHRVIYQKRRPVSFLRPRIILPNINAMKALFLFLVACISVLNCKALESSLAEAEQNPTSITSLVMNGKNGDATRFLRLAPKMTMLSEVIIDGVTDQTMANELVAATAASNKVTRIVFRNCTLNILPANLKMLANVQSFSSKNSQFVDGEQFYTTIADMPSVNSVSVEGSDFQTLPVAFKRMRFMDNVSLVNNDIQLASGYDLNTKLPSELVSSDTVHFGFGNDVLNLSYSCYNEDACTAHLQMFRDVLQGATRASNVFYAPLQNTIFRKHHPLVKPPVKGLDVYPDVYSLNALTGSVLTYGSGTRIIVPSMAFEDANGGVVTGNVDVTYREFRDPIDIVLSGIPMQYDSGGVVGDFKSAGMFEINASQNGAEVYLREGKKIDMKFAVVDTASNYNFYNLDDKNGWTYLSATGTTESDAVSPEVAMADTRNPYVQLISKVDSTVAPDGVSMWNGSSTFAVNRYWEKIRSVRVRNWIKDTTAFDARYEDTCYFGTSRQVVMNDNWTWAQKRKLSSRLCLRKRASGKDYTVLSIGQVSAAHGLNPELSAYGGYLWKIDGRMNSKEVSSRFGRKSGINDCRVLQEGGDYYLEFKYHWGYDKIKAEPITLNDNKKPVSMSDTKQQRLFDSYTKRLNNRRHQMERNNNQQITQQRNRIQRAHNDSVRVWKGLKKQMNEEEKVYDFPAWRDYVKKEWTRVNAPILNAKTNTGSAVYQALSISGMGIYNCDQIGRVDKPKTFVSRAIQVAGAAIVPVVIYVIDKVKNMVFTYSGNGPGGVRATYGENTRNYLLSTDKEGNLYKTDEVAFDARQEQVGNAVQLEGEMISGPLATPQSVREAVFGKDPE